MRERGQRLQGGGRAARWLCTAATWLAIGLFVLRFGPLALAGPTQPGAGDPVADLVAAVDEDAWYQDVTTLADFRTRRSLTTGNELARDWLASQLVDYGWRTETQPFVMSGGTSYNVIGELPGRTRPEEVIIVGAHFDSISPQAWANAPGAEDNASGTAAAIQMVRIFSNHPPEATLRVIAFSGEEQGMLGSTAYVASLDAAELDRIQAVVIMDMVGYTGDDELDVLLETYAWAEPLRAVLRTAAGQWTSLATYNSNSPFGSDHMPFLGQGLQTVLLIQNEWDTYRCYHSTCDLPDQLSKPQGREIMKMLAAALAELAGSCHLTDADCSGLVTVADVQMVAAHWNSDNTQPGFDHRRDLNHDGRVDLGDVALAAQDWGWTASLARADQRPH